MNEKQFQITALSVPLGIISKIPSVPSASDLSMIDASIAAQIMNMSYSYSGLGASFSPEQNPVEKGRAATLSTKTKRGILYQIETRLIPTGIRIPFKVTSSQSIYNLMKQVYAELHGYNHRESFFVIALNRANYVMGIEKISTGGYSGVLVDPKTIFTILLGIGASAFICVHNHPSNNTNPSESDKFLTKKLKEAGKVIEIDFLDHIIYTDKRHYSFSDEGMMS